MSPSPEKRPRKSVPRKVPRPRRPPQLLVPLHETVALIEEIKKAKNGKEQEGQSAQEKRTQKDGWGHLLYDIIGEQVFKKYLCERDIASCWAVNKHWRASMRDVLKRKTPHELAIALDYALSAKRQHPDEHLRVVKLLVEFGVDVNMQVNEDGFTHLASAAHLDHYECANILIKQGADLNRPVRMPRKGENGWSPLHFAVSQGHYTGDYRVANLLIEKGADLNKGIERQLELKGQTPLMTALEGYSKNMPAYLDIVQTLLEAGADVNKPEANKQHEDYFTPCGMTPLIRAVMISNNVSDENQGTIHEAVKMLLNFNADPDRIDQEDGTALHYAVKHGSVDIVKILLDKGANPLVQNKYGESALQMAAEKDDYLNIKDMINAAILHFKHVAP